MNTISRPPSLAAGRAFDPECTCCAARFLAERWKRPKSRVPARNDDRSCKDARKKTFSSWRWSFGMRPSRRECDDVAELIRLKATPDLLEDIEPASGPTNGGYVELPPRAYRLEVGDIVRLEFSFGGMHDQVLVFGMVVAVARVQFHRRVRVEVLARDAKRLEYVRSVLRRQRVPGARRHRRVRFRTPVSIEVQGESQRAHTGDLGCGGAFIVSDQPPPLNSQVQLELRLEGREKIRAPARVAWVGTAGDDLGFGVEFTLNNGDLECVREIVKLNED